MSSLSVKKNAWFQVALFLLFGVFSSTGVLAALDPPHDESKSVGCLSCHDLTSSEPKHLPSMGHTSQDIDDTLCNNLCWSCHQDPIMPPIYRETHSSKMVGSKYGNWTVECWVCHNQHSQEQPGGKFIRAKINLADITNAGKSGIKNVVFASSSEPNSFADGDSVYNGICEVCHTLTTHFRNDGSGNDQLHTNMGTVAGTDCTTCHNHSNGFAHGGGAGIGCEECHGHDPGYGGVTGGAGTYKSHSTHTENDIDDLRGPNITCDACHDINDFPYFKTGTDGNGDGRFSLSETDVCTLCHSPAGTYDGVDHAEIGAKYGNGGTLSYNWRNRIYDDSDNTSLLPGNEKWCATCHDEAASIISSVTAPNVIGDEDGTYTYGTGWGYYKTGHGLGAGEQYPSKGGVETLSGRPVKCDSCHDYATPHIDGVSRTYDDGDIAAINPSLYRQGYRLKLISGQEPMQIPRPFATGNSADLSRVCFQIGCHDSGPFIDPANMNTNLVTGSINRHEYHMIQMNERYASDWSGANNSGITCVNCHNVHGSTRLAMVRDGKLINREPGLQIWYKNDGVTNIITNSFTPPDPEDLLLPASDGTAWFGASSTNLCTHCHNWGIRTADRIPFQDVGRAPLLAWAGTTGLISDGVVPDSAAGNSIFTFRVSYNDENNDSPSPIEVWVDLNDNGSYEAGEKYAMTATEALDTNMLNGAILTKSLAIARAGDGVLTYRFYALDGFLEATGPPTADSTLTLLNNPPSLTWTGENFYKTDGVNPDPGGNGNTFTFRMSYTDSDNEAPSSVQVWIDENDDTIYDPAEKYDLGEVDFSDQTYSDGKLYTRSLSLAHAGDGNLKYRFHAADANDNATGTPTQDRVLTVTAGSNSPPFMEFVAAGCTVRGVKPQSGADNADFVFTVQYVDPEGQCPPNIGDIQLWVDVNDNLIYDASEQLNMTAVDPTDTLCTDGKLYTATLALTLAGDNILNYRFYASDGTDTAVGTPTSDHNVTVVDALKVRPAGGPGWYATIQEAVDAVNNDHTALVYEGTYNEDIVFDRTNDNNTVLRSVCGPDMTIINGTGNGKVVTFSRNVGNIIDGFQVTGGTTGISIEGAQTTVNNCLVHDINNGLSGLSVLQSGDLPTLTLTNSEIYNNSSDRGGGVRINRGTGHTISNTIIRNNTATGDSLADGGGGLHVFQVGTLAISNSLISDNTTSADYAGGGIYAAQVTELTVGDTVIRNNISNGGGGGVFSSDSTTSFIRSQIIGNTATEYGGAIRHPSAGSNASFTNCIVADNQASQGGMAFINGGTFDIINSTIANNQATVSTSGMIYNQLAAVTIRNSILWGNQATTTGHISHFNGGSMIISDSIIQSGDDGNFVNEPFFSGDVTPVVNGFASEDDPWFMGSGDYHIQAFSPAVDRASAVYAPADDIDGDIRPQGAADDMGADEYVP